MQLSNVMMYQVKGGITKMKYYSVEEILEEIDTRFAYDFEGRKKIRI